MHRDSIKKINKILIFSSILTNISTGLLGPLYGIYAMRIGGDFLDAGVAYGIFYIISGVFSFRIGMSRFYHKHLSQMVILGYALTTLGEAGYLFVKNPLDLFIVQVILGFSISILSISWDSLFSIKLTEQQSASSWTLWGGGTDIAIGLGAIAGGFIVSTYSFQTLFITMAVFNCAATLASLLLLQINHHAS